jgi:hypothetical protein
MAMAVAAEVLADICIHRQFLYQMLVMQLL